MTVINYVCRESISGGVDDIGPNNQIVNNTVKVGNNGADVGPQQGGVIFALPTTYITNGRIMRLVETVVESLHKSLVKNALFTFIYYTSMLYHIRVSLLVIPYGKKAKLTSRQIT